MKGFVLSILRDMGFIRTDGLNGVDRGLSREDKEFCYRQMAKWHDEEMAVRHLYDVAGYYRQNGGR